jgi:O-antigen/teichoic acid export membrane protein
MPPLTVPAPEKAAPPRFSARVRLSALLGERGSSRRTLARNGAWSAGAFLAGAMVAFVLRPHLIGWLGTTTFGVWLIVSSLTGWFGLADAGVRPAVVHYVASHDARGDWETVNRYVNSAFATFAVGGGVVLLAAGVFAALLPSLFDLPAGMVTAARVALLVSAADLSLSLPWNAYSAVVVGKQRYDVLNRINLVVLVAKTAAIVLLLASGGGIVALAFANFFGTALEMAWKTRAAFRIEPRLRFAPRLAERGAARDLLGYGAMAVVVSLSGQLIWWADPVVIGSMIEIPAVTWFANGASLPSYVRQLLGAAGRVIEPAAGALGAQGDRAALERIFRNGARTMLGLAAPMLVYLLVFGEAFLTRWLGPEQAGESARVMAIFSLAVAAPIASYPFVAVMYGTNQVRVLALVALGEGLANVVLSIALARSLGIVGVAIGTAVPAALVHAVLLPRLVLRRYDLPLAPYLLGVWARPLAASAITALALMAVPLGDGVPGWPLLFGLAAGTALLFGLVWLALSRLVPEGKASAAEVAR